VRVIAVFAPVNRYPNSHHRATESGQRREQSVLGVSACLLSKAFTINDFDAH
jgi:hypothetical protein